MSTPLRVLIIEDLEDDALLLVKELKRGGYDPTFERVYTAEAVHAALANQTWDLVLCDYVMPNFNALEALQLLQKSGPDLPTIVVSGTVGEEIAVETMRAGAHDYIMKDNLLRLVPAIERELEEAKGRRARREAEQALREAHDELKEAYDTLERTQATAIASEKLAAVGRLTAGVSHEVLNPLNVINLVIQRLLDDPDIDPSLAEDLRGIEKQADRIVKISQDLLSFSRQRTPERRSIDLNEAVRRTPALLEYDLKLQNIDVEMNLAEDLPLILADEGQLQQVILNLLTNARDVMPKGGRLVLRTAEVEPLFADRERAVELRVEDTGPGISPGEMDKLFEPFFTTKPVGEGTGLGLSVCQGIVEAHGGVIWAENVSDGGAAFIVHLNVERE